MSPHLWGIRPACRGVAMSDKLTLSDTIREPAQTPCQTPQNQALSPSWPAQTAAPEATFDAAEASENAVRRLSGDPLPSTPGLARTCNRPHPKPSGYRARSGALPLIPGTTPRRRIATGRSPTWRGAPPLPRPSSPARLQRGPRRSLATSPRSAVQRRPGGRMTPGPGSPAGPSRRAKRHRPGAPGLALQAAPPRPAPARHPTRRAIFTKAPGTARWPKAGRRGA